MRKITLLAILSFCFLSPGNLLHGQLKLPVLLSDGMIIQRDANVRIWGRASPGERVDVRFRGKSHKAKTGPDGRWQVWLPPMKAGGPFSMEITAGSTIAIKDILIGDVWICSGQSNMEHYLELHKERYAEDIAQADYPEIRQFLVPRNPSLEGPQEDLPAGDWKPANPEDVKRFSVVAWFFAKALYDRYRVPIGLINASVGGSSIEAWTSEGGLQGFPEMIRTLEKNRDTAYVNSTNRAARAEMLERNRIKEQDRGLTGSPPWFDTAYAAKNWHNINIPGYWEDQGVKDLDGAVWYRREINIPESMTGVPARIALGRIVDADYLYINGVQAGNTTYQYPQRRYTLPAGILKPGKNLFVIRVINDSGKGGFVPDKPYFLAAGGQTLDLKGTWQYKVGNVFSWESDFTGEIPLHKQPAALFNGMIAPVTSHTIRGIIWYQGESNAGRPEEYKRLQPALIADWRSQWGQGDLPFLYVQLPNYMDVGYSPSESNWALLREAQLEALAIPGTGMAVAIDLGEWNDIHPGNKKPVGERLALAARKVAYGERDIVFSGPILRSTRTGGNKIILAFDHVGSGLISGNGEELNHFAIAGPDKKFVWGKALIENDEVVVWNDDIPDPVYVRYAWADNPDFANLYNREGLPASPFRTDK